MRIKSISELLVLNLLSVVLVLIISLTDTQIIRIILGIPFLLFIPGYTFIAALFPRRSDMGLYERIVLSLGLSIVIAPILGLTLSFILSVELYPIIISLLLFTAGSSGIAWYRRRHVPEEDRIDIVISKRQVRLFSDNPKRLSYIILSISILSAVVTLGYSATSSKTGEEYTEFYILGSEGMIDSYPKEIILDSEGNVATVKYLEEVFIRQGQYATELKPVAEKQARVIAGIRNHEQQTKQYEIELSIDGIMQKNIGPVTLMDGHGWEEKVSFVPFKACAITHLTTGTYINKSADQPVNNIIQVDNASFFNSGDHILIDTETAKIVSIHDNFIILEESLSRYHKAKTDVIEMQKVEFRLFEVASLDDEYTQFSLWAGVNDISYRITNTGTSAAVYRLEMKWGDTEPAKAGATSGPYVIPPGEGKRVTVQIDGVTSEKDQIDISLYRNYSLIHHEMIRPNFLEAYLWITVHEGGEG